MSNSNTSIIPIAFAAATVHETRFELIEDRDMIWLV